MFVIFLTGNTDTFPARGTGKTASYKYVWSTAELLECKISIIKVKDKQTEQIRMFYNSEFIFPFIFLFKIL